MEWWNNPNKHTQTLYSNYTGESCSTMVHVCVSFSSRADEPEPHSAKTTTTTTTTTRKPPSPWHPQRVSRRWLDSRVLQPPASCSSQRSIPYYILLLRTPGMFHAVVVVDGVSCFIGVLYDDSNRGNVVVWSVDCHTLRYLTLFQSATPL